MFPERAQRLCQGSFQFLQRLKDPIRQRLTYLTKDLLGRIEFGAVGGQGDRLVASWPVDLPTTMAAGIVQHNPHWLVPEGAVDFPQERLQSA